jgi:hypothetical protein
VIAPNEPPRKLRIYGDEQDPKALSNASAATAPAIWLPGPDNEMIGLPGAPCIS